MIVYSFIVDEKRNCTFTEKQVIDHNKDLLASFTLPAGFKEAGDIVTARFSYGNKFQDVILNEEDKCLIPISVAKYGIMNVGVFTDTKATTPAKVNIDKSILNDAGYPVPTEKDLWTEIIELLKSIDPEGIGVLVDQYVEAHKDELKGDKGDPGTPGSPGTTFTPAVNSEGVISWTNDGGKENPQSKNIRGPQGENGSDGSDGFSPVITTQRSGGVVNISITDATHTEVTTLADGEDGHDGTDGVSPVATVSKSGTVTTVTVTDKTGTTTAQINDGVNGINGTDGHTPVKGTDYWTAQDQADIVADVLSELINAETVSM